MDYTRKLASPEDVALVLAAGEHGEGRSPFYWFWVGSDLVLGVYPKGDTYWATEMDHFSDDSFESVQG